MSSRPANNSIQNGNLRRANNNTERTLQSTSSGSFQDAFTYDEIQYRSLEDYITYLRFDVFPTANVSDLKKLLSLLFHFKWRNEMYFNNLRTFIIKQDLQGAIRFLESVVGDVRTQKRKFTEGIETITGETPVEIKDLDMILTLYLEETDIKQSYNLLRCLMFSPFKTLDNFKTFCEMYMEADRVKRQEMVSGPIYSSYVI
jgi:hypothetical protein